MLVYENALRYFNSQTIYISLWEELIKNEDKNVHRYAVRGKKKLCGKREKERERERDRERGRERGRYGISLGYRDTS